MLLPIDTLIMVFDWRETCSMNVIMRCLMICFLLLGVGCQTMAVQERLGRDVFCTTDSPNERPAWVLTPPNRQGFYVGVGVSAASPTYGDGLAVATQRARLDLAASISTSVRRIIHSSASAYQSQGLSFSQEYTQVIAEATTQMSLENARRVATWRDSETCQLWVQVQVDESMVDAYLARHQNKQILHRAEALFGLSADKTQSLAARIHRLKMALALLNEVDFERLPMQNIEFYQPRFQHRLAVLEAQLTQAQTLVLVRASSPLANQLSPLVASEVASIVQGRTSHSKNNCTSTSNCLMMARKSGATQLVLVALDATVYGGSMGSDVGELAVTVVLYDAISGQILAMSAPSKADVFSFENNLDWPLAIQRVLGTLLLRPI